MLSQGVALDLSLPRFVKDVQVTDLPPDLAVLMVGIAARQASSPTALVATRMLRAPEEETLFAPVDGAFNGTVATAFLRWRQE